MIYGLFLAYTKDEVTGIPSSSVKYPYYPKGYRRIRLFNTPSEQLNAYANTPCPASQMITGEDEEDFKNKVNQMNDNFDNVDWLEENIFPYV